MKQFDLKHSTYLMFFSDLFLPFERLIEDERPIDACGVYAIAKSIECETRILWPTIYKKDKQHEFMGSTFNEENSKFKLWVLWHSTEDPSKKKFQSSEFKANHFSLVTNEDLTLDCIEGPGKEMKETQEEDFESYDLSTQDEKKFKLEQMQAKEKTSSSEPSSSSVSSSDDKTENSQVHSVSSTTSDDVTDTSQEKSVSSTTDERTENVVENEPEKTKESIEDVHFEKEVITLESRSEDGDVVEVPKVTAEKEVSTTSHHNTEGQDQLESEEYQSKDDDFQVDKNKMRSSHEKEVKEEGEEKKEEKTKDLEVGKEENEGEVKEHEDEEEEEITTNPYLKYRMWFEILNFALEGRADQILPDLKKYAAVDKHGQIFLVNNTRNRNRHREGKPMLWPDYDGQWDSRPFPKEFFIRDGKGNKFNRITTMTYDMKTKQILYKENRKPVPPEVRQDLIVMYKYSSNSKKDKAYSRKITSFLVAPPDLEYLLDRSVYEYYGKFPGYMVYGGKQVSI